MKLFRWGGGDNIKYYQVNREEYLIEQIREEKGKKGFGKQYFIFQNYEKCAQKINENLKNIKF